MNKWLDLAQRCEQATKPDREIDLAIIYAAYPDIGNYVGQCIGDYPIFWHAPYRKQECPNLTASLDAITALIERELPGWMVFVQWCGISVEAWVAPDLNNPLCAPEIRADEARWHDYAERNEVEMRPGSRYKAALVLCAAFCRAMHEKESNDVK